MRHDFYARVARLEEQAGARVGGATLPSREPVRFAPSFSLAFPTRELDAREDSPTVLTTAFLGLGGSGGALPAFLLDELADEDDERPTRRTLLAPFHHRAVSLLHRSVHRCRVPDSTRALGDAWPTRLAALVAPGAPEDDDVRALMLAVAPLLFGRPSARSLVRAVGILSARMLRGAPIDLVARSGGRVALSARHRARLGSARLGECAVLGASVADPGHEATLVVGPVASDLAHALLGGGAPRRALEELVRLLGPPDVTFTLRILHVADAPAQVGRSVLGSSALLGAARGKRSEAYRAESCALDATPDGPAR